MKQVLKQVKRLEIRTRRLVDGLLQGAYHSIFKGRGIEFSEVREYMYGDDIRSIDWNVTARMNHPFVKEFIEERDLSVLFLFDVSASGEFGSERRKRDSAIEMAASLAFAAMRNNDNVGLALFTDRIEKFVPLRKGRRHVLKVIREMLYFKPQNKTSDLNKPLKYIANVLKKRAIVFIISDFLYERNYRRILKTLNARHDCIAININDIREHEIPDIGFIELEDEETGEQMLVDTSDPEFREEYAALVRKRNNENKRFMSRLGVDSIQLLSDQPYEVPLRQFFRMRLKRWT